MTPYDADLYLFGSRARGIPRAASDIDLAIDPHGPLPRSALSSLRELFEESTVPVHVDVLDLRDAGPGLRQRVLREGVRWNALAERLSLAAKAVESLRDVSDVRSPSDLERDAGLLRFACAAGAVW